MLLVVNDKVGDAAPRTVTANGILLLPKMSIKPLPFEL
jgi:hypothetical protein